MYLRNSLHGREHECKLHRLRCRRCFGRKLREICCRKSGQPGAPDDAPVITAADVQALIDALPEAETISEDNAADVEAQLEAIDEAKVQLSDEDFAVLDFTRYDAAVAALMALSGEPDTAFAPQTANDHTHCYCGGSITAGDHASHSDVTYTAWDGTSSITYTNNTAYVYLTENATLSGHLTVDGKTLYLCLNGKTLASNGTAKIQVKTAVDLFSATVRVAAPLRARRRMSGAVPAFTFIPARWICSAASSPAAKSPAMAAAEPSLWMTSSAYSICTVAKSPATTATTTAAPFPEIQCKHAEHHRRHFQYVWRHNQE